MDDLHRKLDQLLARSSGGSCPMCGMCTQHSRQQEATVSQLSAQTKLLENLERKVMELRNALEELTESRFTEMIPHYQFHLILDL